MLIISLDAMNADQRSRAAARLVDAGPQVRAHTPRLFSTNGDRAMVVAALGDLAESARLTDIPAAYPHSARFPGQETTRVRFGRAGATASVGGTGFTVIAGPCSVEHREQMLQAAGAVREAGAHALRGGAYKPRTNPYSFQGLGPAGLELLAEARETTGLPVVSEIVDVRDVELMAAHVDVFQVGARNMQNYTLLRELGRAGHPVLLKRGLAATVEETLMAAEYLLDEGNEDVVLCERGIRTFESSYRFTLDLAALTVFKERTHLPVIVDPSHAAGLTDRVIPLALAAAAAGADGLIVESHPDPAEALCDAGQALPTSRLCELMGRLEFAVAAAGRSLAQPPAGDVADDVADRTPVLAGGAAR
ncbi:3-deoxy-7-phosphoheptulonate synthase [Streptomyces sp. HM190]|uniref:3-deoxy-7-phosphoheptulonate synthase n=1 Tax=Streptomyces sp. HM190 TaxID=2695266 RepID=UPI0019174D7F|nr:3-deoxy-7-phosphoheptulonate synthase [Streptomyces sp. HM190]